MDSNEQATGLNIAALSRRTGLAPDTLRKWEHRYGVLHPSRTPGGQRRYDEADVARVEWLKARLGEGYRIGEAAALLGGVDPIPPNARLKDALFEAVVDVDADRLGHLLDHAFALDSIEGTLRHVVEPLLRQTGDAWQHGRVTVAQEHLVSEAVRARLERLLADARAAVRGVAVLACAPDERHDLGLLMLAVLLRADGWQVAYLGADTPLGDALELSREVGARTLCLSATMTERAHALTRALEPVRVPRGIELVFGGAGASPEGAAALGARYANGSLARAVATIRELAP